MRPYSVFILGNILLVSIQEEIDDKNVQRLLGILGSLVIKHRITAVIFDLHDVEVVDTFLATNIERLADMLRLLEARVMISGLSVPAVLTLLDFKIQLRGVGFALDVEQALEKLGKPGGTLPLRPHHV